MKINGKEITGCGIIETALDGLDAREYCLCVTYKKDRKNGKGYDIRRTTLPEIVRRNQDLALAIPEFVGENMNESVALTTCEKFAEKFNLPMLAIERKRLEELKAAAAAKKAAKTANGESGESGESTKTEKKPKKTIEQRIVDIINKEKSQSRLYRFTLLMPAIESIDRKVANIIYNVIQKEYIPECGKATAAK